MTILRTATIQLATMLFASSTSAIVITSLRQRNQEIALTFPRRWKLLLHQRRWQFIWMEPDQNSAAGTRWISPSFHLFPEPIFVQNNNIALDRK